MANDVAGTKHGPHLAARLEQDNPDWVIMYGAYSREFVAFAGYPGAPPGSHCAAKNPAALQDLIREAESLHATLRLGAARQFAGTAVAGSCSVFEPAADLSA